VAAIAEMAAGRQVGDVRERTVEIDAVAPELQLAHARIVDQQAALR
jgi:hypothetical protein